MLTSSSQHDVRTLEAGEGTLVGGHTEVLKNEGASQEVQVVAVRDKGRGQGSVQSCIGCSTEGITNVDQGALH